MVVVVPQFHSYSTPRPLLMIGARGRGLDFKPPTLNPQSFVVTAVAMSELGVVDVGLKVFLKSPKPAFLGRLPKNPLGVVL